MAKNTKLAIIGLGKMGSIHLKAVEEIRHGAHEDYYKGGVGAYLDKIALEALVDPSAKHGSGPACYGGYKEMLAEKKIDAAIVASPTVTHFAMAKDLLERGISLLVEKPVACFSREIKELKKIAAASGAFLMPGHVERYNPVTLDIIESLSYKIYGKVSHYEFTRTSRRPARIPDSIVVDKLVHDLDLLLFFFGKPTISDIHFEYDGKGQVVECDLRLKHNNGISGRILSSWKVAHKQRTINISAERGEICGDFLRKSLFIKRLREFSKTITGYANNQVKDQFADFIAGIYGLSKPLVNIDDAINCGIIIDQVEKLAEASRPGRRRGH